MAERSADLDNPDRRSFSRLTDEDECTINAALLKQSDDAELQALVHYGGGEGKKMKNAGVNRAFAKPIFFGHAVLLSHY